MATFEIPQIVPVPTNNPEPTRRGQEQKFGDTPKPVEITASGGIIRVRDHGRGLDEGETQAVFDRFHRGRSGRAGPPGTGLGLSIARELARRWGGDLTLTNADDGGAVATITMPVASAR